MQSEEDMRVFDAINMATASEVRMNRDATLQVQQAIAEQMQQDIQKAKEEGERERDKIAKEAYENSIIVKNVTGWLEV